jgi:hypothetical protein
LEPGYKKPKYRIEQDAFGNTIKLFDGMWGLKSNQCWVMGLPGMDITLPVGAWAETGSIDSDYSSDDGASSLGDTQDSGSAYTGYTVAISATQRFFKVIPKIEYISQQLISETDVASVDYHFKDIRENNLRLLGGSNNTCIPDLGDIDNYIQALSTNSHFSMSTAQKKISYKVPGVATSAYSVSQGLSSIQVSLTNNGFYTSYILEDKIIRKPSDDYILQSILAKTIDRGTLASSYQNGPGSKMIGYSYKNGGGFGNVSNPGGIKQ